MPRSPLPRRTSPRNDQIRSPSPSTTLNVRPRRAGSTAASANRSAQFSTCVIGTWVGGPMTRWSREIWMPERREVRVVPAPDEARAEHGQLPAVGGAGPAHHALLPGLGDGVAVALVEVGNGLESASPRPGCPGWRSSRRPRSCWPAPPAGSRSGPSPRAAAPCRPPSRRTGRPRPRSPPPRGAPAPPPRRRPGPGPRRRRRSARTTSTEAGQPSRLHPGAGRTRARTSTPRPKQGGDHVPAEEPRGAGDQDLHGRPPSRPPASRSGWAAGASSSGLERLDHPVHLQHLVERHRRLGAALERAVDPGEQLEQPLVAPGATGELAHAACRPPPAPRPVPSASPLMNGRSGFGPGRSPSKVTPGLEEVGAGLHPAVDPEPEGVGLGRGAETERRRSRVRPRPRPGTRRSAGRWRRAWSTASGPSGAGRRRGAPARRGGGGSRRWRPPLSARRGMGEFGSAKPAGPRMSRQRLTSTCTTLPSSPALDAAEDSAAARLKR